MGGAGRRSGSGGGRPASAARTPNTWSSASPNSTPPRTSRATLPGSGKPPVWAIPQRLSRGRSTAIHAMQRSVLDTSSPVLASVTTSSQTPPSRPTAKATGGGVLAVLRAVGGEGVARAVHGALPCFCLPHWLVRHVAGGGDAHDLKPLLGEALQPRARPRSEPRARRRAAGSRRAFALARAGIYLPRAPRTLEKADLHAATFTGLVEPQSTTCSPSCAGDAQRVARSGSAPQRRPGRCDAQPSEEVHQG